MEGEEENVTVTYGTPLAEDDDEEIPRKRPVRIEDQIVTDERGLRRFHGAFTGGFSAGYFNTVGTKEGWTPATFVSTRSTRADKKSQRPEDYMDDEDLGQFGIAPREMHVQKEFAKEKSSGEHRKRKRPLAQINEGPIPTGTFLKELIVPVRESIGVLLLRKMGWRPGQGIGPRVKRKEKKMRLKSIGPKVYGCSLPNESSDDENSSDDELLRGITFAPDDVKISLLKTKDNLNGIGYSGLDKNPVLSTFRSRFTEQPAIVDKQKKLAIAGEAFGVGAFENDDESIYTSEDISQYDFEIGDSSIQETNSSRRKGRDPKIGYVGRELEGFHISSIPLAKKQVYPSPVLPKTFQPFHKLHATPESSQNTTQQSGMDRHSRMTALDRAAAIDNLPSTGSVFDFLRPEDRARLQAFKAGGTPPLPPPGPSNTSTPEVAIPETKTIAPIRRSSDGTFRPFAQDEDKQKRYEIFLKLNDGNKSDMFSKCQLSSMTEWEKQREQEEFSRAAAIYKPLAQNMASRFVTAKYADTDVQPVIEKDSVNESKEAQITRQAKDVRLNGKALRIQQEWHPDSMLCRRFNIPNPYPNSTLVGTLEVLKDKYSMINFITASSATRKSNDSGPVLTEGLTISMNEKPMETMSSMETNPTANQKPQVAIVNLFSCLNCPDPVRALSTPSNIATKEAVPTSLVTTEAVEEQEDDDDSEQQASPPPMDMFKAIFQDTESETSSNEDEVKEIPKPPSTTPSITFSLAEIAPPTQEKPKNITRHGTGIFADLDLDNLNSKPPNEPLNPRLSSIAVKATSTINTVHSTTLSQNQSYGPALPPHLAKTPVSETTKGREPHSSAYKDKKSKHKNKHKKKKKKSTSKHKHKSKSSSSDEESSESDEWQEINKSILTKFRKLKKL